MEDKIKEKFHIASHNKNSKMEFLGVDGNKNPDHVLQKMVDKLVKEQV